jgi:hypothetical protein
MTPAVFNFDIYKGAKWEHTLTFKVSGTTTPINLSGLGPFVFTVTKPNTDTPIFDATITSNYDATGVMTVTIPSSLTDSLFVSQQVRYGLRDAQNNPYMVGVLTVKYFSPNPA